MSAVSAGDLVLEANQSAVVELGVGQAVELRRFGKPVCKVVNTDGTKAGFVVYLRGNLHVGVGLGNITDADGEGPWWE